MLHDLLLLTPLARRLAGLGGEFLTMAAMEIPSTNTVLVGSVRVRIGNFQENSGRTEYQLYFSRRRWRTGSRHLEGSGYRMQPDIFCALVAKAVRSDPSSTAFRRGTWPRTSRRMQHMLLSRTIIPLVGLRLLSY
jgi:hypothetical protein